MYKILKEWIKIIIILQKKCMQSRKKKKGSLPPRSPDFWAGGKHTLECGNTYSPGICLLTSARHRTKAMWTGLQTPHNWQRTETQACMCSHPCSFATGVHGSRCLPLSEATPIMVTPTNDFWGITGHREKKLPCVLNEICLACYLTSSAKF